MQHNAAAGVMKLYPPGASIYTVVENVGPGSVGWPYKVGPLKSGQISFNVDGTFVCGITFYYEDEKVIRSEIFD
ncbi:MAG: hypothetical protein EOP86_20910 [Verrucomicrobiaceae bacterium]|nr:MAG: hypothetical protein EOP86_20910 [Verrucomicrobiaceae bacterium]